MKVQTNYSHYIPDKGKPAFGNYVIDKRIGRAVGVLVPKDIKTFYALGKNNGENLNNTVTAVGTAGVAPIFIRFNPLSDEDPKVKAYSALSQPLSAVLALGVQLPVMTAYNYLLDKWATSGKVRRIDLSAKPPEAVLRSYAKSRYNQELREFLAAGNSVDDLEKNFYKGRNKQQYIEDIIQEARNNIFYAQRDKMRRLAKEDLPITTSVLRDENGKVKDWFHPTKLSEIKDIEFVKPDELDKARKDVYAQVLKEFGVNPDDKKLFNIKIDWEDKNALDKHKKMKSGEIPVTESLKDYKKSAVKRALKKAGTKYSDFKTKLEQTAENEAIAKVKNELAEETRVKFETSKAFNELVNKFAIEKKRVFDDTSIPVEQKEAHILEAEKKLIAQKVANLEQRINDKETDDAARKTLVRAVDKIKNKKINEIRLHGSTMEEVETSVKVKKWLRAEINRREGVFKNFKKLSGLIFGLAILPFTCGLLNWAYPRFMEKFFPGLCDAKKQANAAKEAK